MDDVKYRVTLVPLPENVENRDCVKGVGSNNIRSVNATNRILDFMPRSENPPINEYINATPTLNRIDIHVR
jgi:hypothetical protein